MLKMLNKLINMICRPSEGWDPGLLRTVILNLFQDPCLKEEERTGSQPSDYAKASTDRSLGLPAIAHRALAGRRTKLTKLNVIFFIGSLLFTSPLFTHSIVFVHIGPRLPTYLPDALQQARIFNKTCKIYLLANQEALAHYTDTIKATQIPLETIKKTPTHNTFIQQSIFDRPTQDPSSRQGFNYCTIERFLFLDDFMQQYQEQDVVHLESDVMLYVDLATIMPLLRDKYKGLGAVFDNDDRCIPSFIYMAHEKSMSKLAECFLAHARTSFLDMEIIAFFKNTHDKHEIDHLPIIMPAYHAKHKLISPAGYRTATPSRYSNHTGLFKSVFDAAALGQYLGGIDPRNGQSVPGFINESCLFNPANLTITMIPDHEGRDVPYMKFDNEMYRINNLHIHSKNLNPFLSIKKKAEIRNYINGDKFKELADYCVEDNHHTFKPTEVASHSIIFVETDSLGYFFSTVFPQLTEAIILISHNSELPCPGNFTSYLNHSKIIHWFGSNSSIHQHEKFTPIPLGIANESWEHGNPKNFDYVLDRLEKTSPQEKLSLLYINIDPKTNPIRTKLLDYFQRHRFAVYASLQLSKDYLTEMSHYRYVLSPQGYSLDAHRTWEALLVGSIPIIKSSTLDSLYNDLPVIIVENWQDVTKDYLEKEYQAMLKKTFNRSKFFMNYWIDLIKDGKKGAYERSV